MSLGENITKLRQCNNLSVEELAKKLNVTVDDIKYWENGYQEPSIDELKSLSELFNISIDELTGNTCHVDKNKKVFYVGYEYKSKKEIKGIPLVHVSVGKGKKARGIIAIGNNAKGVLAIGGKAVGLFSIGGISIGLISIGGLGFGLISIAGFALALLMSIGGISIAPFAIGGVALGILTLGGLSIGFYSVGGCAIGNYVTIGGYASGHIAIGYKTNGDITPIKPTSVELKNLIKEYYPNTWSFVTSFMSLFLR